MGRIPPDGGLLRVSRSGQDIPNHSKRPIRTAEHCTLDKNCQTRGVTLTTFAELGVSQPVVAALAEVGIIEAFPIQQMCIPQALEGRDLIGQAKTGTGKTLGFGIPLLERIIDPADPTYAQLPVLAQGAPQALVVVPTRELCVQVAADLAVAAKHLKTRIAAIYGGRAYEPQVEALKRGIDVVVSTPGRLIDLADQRKLHLGHVKVLVLDEADEMLDMGFLPDVERIVTKLPAGRQTMLFSATMPAQIVALGRRYMSQPTHIRVVNPDEDSALVDSIEQHVWRAHPLDKAELLARVLQARDRELAIIFTRTKRRAQAVAEELEDRGFAVAAVHGDLNQGAREQALRAFRGGKVDILVATDVAARGLDVDDVSHVINYECPDDEKTYLHRVGRTARAGRSGVAVTLVDWEDVARWQMINTALGLPFHEPLETYHTSEHVAAGLGIPPGVTGRLPRALRIRAGLDAEMVEDLGGASARRAHGSSRPERRGRVRSRDRDLGRGHDHPTDRQPDRTENFEETSKPRRKRRRTRSGAPVGESGAANSPAASSPASESPVPESLAGVAPDGSASPELGGPAKNDGNVGNQAGNSLGVAGRPRRRRRRRSGPHGSPAGVPPETSQDQNDPAAEQP